jgi:hypothetical protein
MQFENTFENILDWDGKSFLFSMLEVFGDGGTKNDSLNLVQKGNAI